jgi:hypothetical protein
MNADFETELAAPPGAYRRTPPFALLNRRLSPHLLWLARPGDALLIGEPWPDRLRAEAERRGVELVSPETSWRQGAGSGRQNARLFTPWGWTPSAVAAGERAGAVVRPVPLDVVARVNSKLWSHALEVESGIALPGAALASSIEELREAIARACPAPDDKWVVKSPYGFAARDRVLGRGPVLEAAQGRWCERRMGRGETLIFQPWLAVVREYGVVLEIAADGSFEVRGVSDLQTNGAGTGTGYVLGRPPDAGRVRELTRVASVVCQRLFQEGYFGPVGIDALEHAGGLHPLLEINARYTMGFVALAVEQQLKPAAPTFWSTKGNDECGMMNDE